MAHCLPLSPFSHLSQAPQLLCLFFVPLEQLRLLTGQHERETLLFIIKGTVISQGIVEVQTPYQPPLQLFSDDFHQLLIHPCPLYDCFGRQPGDYIPVLSFNYMIKGFQ